MAYGHGRDDEQMRMLELASVALGDRPELARLRDGVLAACETLGREAWPDDPTLPLDRKALDRILLPVQSRLSGPLGSKWVEKARLKVAAAIAEQCRRARRTFAGRLLHLDARNERGEPTCLPEELLKPLDGDTLAALAAAVPKRLDRLLAEARDAIGRDDPGPRGAALAWLLRHVTERFGRPVFGADERHVVQLHLDGACLRPAYQGYRDALDRLAAAAPAVLATGTPAEIGLRLTGVSANGDPVPLTACLGPRGLLRALVAEARAAGGDVATVAQALRFRSLCLELGPERATLKAVLARAGAANGELVRSAEQARETAKRRLTKIEAELAAGEAEPVDVDEARARLAKAAAREERSRRGFAAALARCRAVLGVDPGKRTALAATVLAAPDGVDLERALALGRHDKAGMRAVLAGHALPEPERRAVTGHGNGRFLARIATIVAEIAALSRAIDARYRRIGALKARINGALGRAKDTRLPAAADGLPLDGLTSALAAQARRWHKALFRELARVGGRKAARRAAWARIHGVKTSWFGLLANRVAVLALDHGAGVALEDADWGIEEKQDQGYRGKAWNRAMAACSPRKLLERIRDKLDWSGVPLGSRLRGSRPAGRMIASRSWWNVASYYTSQTDHRVAVVAAVQRPRGGPTFTALWDRARSDSDEHASETLAATALMRALDAAGRALRDGILARAARPAAPA